MSRDAGDLPAADALPTRADVLAAARRIRDAVRVTPVLRSDALDALSGAHLLFKCEHQQPGGAFKLRGASHAVARLPTSVAHVCTHSSGNHGAALALAARARGMRCTVVVPEGAPRAKLENMRAAGADILRCAPTQAAREAGLAELVADTGAVPVPPYDHADVIAGQGTVALELLEQAPGLDAIVVPVGGGGLLAGTLLAAAGRCAVVGAEPAGADDTARSLACGRRLTDMQPDTICDGLRATVGVRNFQIIRRAACPVLTVDDDAVREAMRLIARHLGERVEPSAAIALAAVLGARERFAGRRVAVVLTGGNLDEDAPCG